MLNSLPSNIWLFQQNNVEEAVIIKQNALFTSRRGIGNPTSTLLNVKLVFDDVRSVRSFRKSLSILTPSFVSRLHLSVKSVSSFCPFMSVVMTLILSESRSLQIVEVDSLFRPLNNCLPNNLLINVDLPALVSPEICVYNPFFVTNLKKNLNKARCVTQLPIQR